MPISYSIRRDLHLVLEVWTGEVTGRDVRAFWKRYLSDPRVRAIRRTLADWRTCSLRITGPQLSELVDGASAAMPKGSRWATAIVVATPAQHGTAHQFQIFADRSTTAAVFHDYEEATRWILAQDGREAARPAEPDDGTAGGRPGAAWGQ